MFKELHRNYAWRTAALAFALGYALGYAMN